ncbi:MAG: carbohydrate kinase family protein, partial [Chloroflexi bacterium]|nr:carbohydrate kinase family protein [Chloroflexota bacterium]
MKKILIVGGASFDTLHFFGQMQHSPGGGGLYTALAARRCGVDAGIFAPHPHPMPASLQPVADCLSWLGPQVTPDEIPRMEIEHNEKGTTYLSVYSGAESTLDPAQLPADLSGYSAVHVIGLGSMSRQLAFLQACRQRRAPLLSAGANLYGFQSDPQRTQAILDIADALFLNEPEGIALFGSVEAAQAKPGKLIFLTLGAKGVRVIQGSVATYLPTQPVETLDPTGAGDTLCGGTLAFLAQGYHPVEAVRNGMPQAAEAVGTVGPVALLADPPAPPPPPSPKVTLASAQIERVASLVATLPEVADHDFAGPDHPAIGDPATLDFFFASTL